MMEEDEEVTFDARKRAWPDTVTPSSAAEAMMPSGMVGMPAPSSTWEQPNQPTSLPMQLLKLILNKGLRIAPVTFWFGSCTGMIMPVGTELMKTRICEVVYNNTVDFCAKIGQTKDNATEANLIRATTTEYSMYSALISAIPSIIFTLFMGSWSDRHGRRSPLIASVVGFILSCAVSIPVAFLQINPLYLLIGSAVGSLLGGWPIFVSSVNSYIGDHTTEKNRSTIIALNMGCLSAGISAGLKLGTVILQYWGYPTVYFVNLGLHCTSLLYILVFIKDHADFNNKENESMSNANKARGLFQIQGIRDNWEVLTRKRVGNARFHVLLLLGAYTAMVMCIENESVILQQLMEYQPLGWTVGEYGSLASISSICGVIALCMAIPVCKRIFKMSDTTMGIAGSLSALLCAFGYSISIKDWMVWTAMSVGLIRPLSFVCIQAVQIALVERSEVGKMMSILGSIQSVSQILSVVLFQRLFAATAPFWPGCVFAVIAFILVIPLASFCTVDATKYPAPVKYSKQTDC
ncbi:hypothetical protein BV898_17773 [Hypsibius exemplaris]|uniref:Proton-coupled folate transporter n=1 Tax=Hypsibius exemplaris TaxID=2072580 RepID=A0A9X6NFP6_HYPEX|nr:hypothetical protein BV898_17773 [Hypsibius exemplaris]